ncbi:cell envelope biogenesis protein TolA [Bradyrhizobium sp. BR 10289]|uniref:cell envelope biogenesis protein TolA n=1 Tax=Bradyrhizobium sp. BR 10289 TaxID=2749993 RepID=UPI001C64EAE3|nr:cell envelope biogenesis protein TolA [Bradyrhizobium sp. BR 10289]MBW7968400.1 cell envelope biogenesis protein TolA [Bradyrhizobium sp. BR 10289]
MAKKPSRKLKTYQTSLGFYDQAVAAPSMKAALEAFGARSNLFHQGIAKETDDPDIVAATMAAPGVVLKRPVGSDGAFTTHAELPTDLTEDSRTPKRRARSRPKKAASKGAAKRAAKGAARSETDDRQARAAAAAFAREQERRDIARHKEEAELAKARARREKAVAAAEAALEEARGEHQARAEEIEAERAALDEREATEQARWEKQRKKLDEAVRRARE